MDKKIFYILSHTHWDREWYESFQGYRFRLVRMIDDLLEIMENDANYKYFHFDGQTIMLEDYLKIRPENKARIEKLIKDGRIIIGPWYCMPDEFLVSGESLIRNIQKGIKICNAYNVPYMKNGYVNDIFGHNSQFPQILNLFSIDTATLYRGIGDFEKDSFTWEGADKSQVTVYKLDAERSYSNFYFAVRRPFEGAAFKDDELIMRMEKLIQYSLKSSNSDAILMLDGVDHIDAEPEMPRIIQLLNEKFPEYEFKHASFEEFSKAERISTKPLEIISGALYNVAQKGENNFLLKNVLSSQVHLKQANDSCETQLSLVAEPIDAFCNLVTDKLTNENNFRSGMPRKKYFEEAWEYLLKNQPHDSICGCSITDTHIDNEYRFKQTKEITQLMIKDELEQLVRSINTTGKGKDGAVVLLNSSSGDINEYAPFIITIKGGHQLNFRIYDENSNELEYQFIDYYTKLEKETKVRKLVDFTPAEYITVVAKVKIPAFGYTVLTYDNLRNSVLTKGEYRLENYNKPYRIQGTMRVSTSKFDNGKLVISINSTGSLNILNKQTDKLYKNVLVFENTGDVGDGWNYVSPKFNSEFLTISDGTDISIEKEGPFYTVISISKTINLPKTANSLKRSEEKEQYTINSKVKIFKDSERIQVETTVDNTLESHRLRVLIPTDIKTDSFITKTPFDMYEWQIKKDDNTYSKELDTNVNPSQGITLVSDEQNCVAVYTKGLYEIEVKDNEERTIALTLYRSFPNEVGKPEAIMGKMKTKIRCEYMLEFTSNLSNSKAVITDDQYKIGIQTISDKNKDGVLSGNNSFLSISGSAVVSCFYYENGSYFLRIYDVDGGSQGKISFNTPIKSVNTIDFNNNIIKELNINNSSFVYVLQNIQVTTFNIKI